MQLPKFRYFKRILGWAEVRIYLWVGGIHSQLMDFAGAADIKEYF